MSSLLEISLFGTCLVRVTGGSACEIKSAKQRAIVALLVTAPFGRRSRTFLQETLWGHAGYDSGHQNLRRALSDMRKVLGDDFDRFIRPTNRDIEINMDHVRLLGSPRDGVFLDDLNIPAPQFARWVDEIQKSPETILDLFPATPVAAHTRPRPRVTVLPLAVLDTDPNMRVMADWVAEEACRSLSRSNLLSVISHLSSRAMAQRSIDLVSVRDTLDVDYIVTGTLRKRSGEMIVDFDFIDARGGDILWNRHFSCPADSFSDQLQARLVNVIQAIGRSIADSTIDYVKDRPLPMIEDHQLILAGVSLMHRTPMRDFVSSRAYLEEACSRMPNVSLAHAWLAKWYVLSVFKGFSTERSNDTQKALDCTARALDTDSNCSFSLTIDGFAHNNLLKNMGVAEQRYNAALDVNPNEALSWLLRGTLMAFQDEGAAAIKATETAQCLSPIDPFGYYYDSLASSAYIAAENFEEALLRAERSLAKNDRHLSTLRTRTTALHFLGRAEEARKSAQELVRFHPSFNIDEYKRNHPSAGNKAGLRVIEALTASGIT